nr:hypothetical protein [Sphingopyxis granuli]
MDNIRHGDGGSAQYWQERREAFSISRMCRLSVACLIFMFRAARLKLPASAAASR